MHLQILSIITHTENVNTPTGKQSFNLHALYFKHWSVSIMQQELVLHCRNVSCGVSLVDTLVMALKSSPTGLWPLCLSLRCKVSRGRVKEGSAPKNSCQPVGCHSAPPGTVKQREDIGREGAKVVPTWGDSWGGSVAFTTGPPSVCPPWSFSLTCLLFRESKSFLCLLLQTYGV